MAPRKGTKEVLCAPTKVETRFASYLGFGRPRILMFFLTAVFVQTKVHRQDAGRARKDRNVVLRSAAEPSPTRSVRLKPNAAMGTCRTFKEQVFRSMKPSNPIGPLCLQGKGEFNRCSGNTAIYCYWGDLIICCYIGNITTDLHQGNITNYF